MRKEAVLSQDLIILQKWCLRLASGVSGGCVVPVVAVVAENWCQLLGMTFAATARQRSLRIYPTSKTFNVPPLTRGKSKTNWGLCKMNRKKNNLALCSPKSVLPPGER